MRDVPPPTTAGSDSLRPLLGVALLLAVVAGSAGYLAFTAGDDGDGTTVEITVVPVSEDDATPGYYPASKFPSSSPVVETVEAADRSGETERRTATVESREQVRPLGGDPGETYHVALAEAESETRFFRVTVQSAAA